MGNRITTMRLIIPLTREDLIKCINYAEESWVYYPNEHKRSKQGVIDDIVRGKLGEIGAARMYEEMGLLIKGPSFECRKKPDPGYDIIVKPEEKINVKTLFADNVNFKGHTEVQIKYDYDKKGGCTEYVLMLISNDLTEAEYYGTCKSSEFVHPDRIPTRKNLDGSWRQVLIINNHFTKLFKIQTI